mmetsp:Transcript_6778/g.10217  ORF Transcript_6778/g.10217 Transcript_6778/m.10217 type:complete len:169 (-) Transcript_6778:190-696(-)
MSTVKILLAITTLILGASCVLGFSQAPFFSSSIVRQSFQIHQSSNQRRSVDAGFTVSTARSTALLAGDDDEDKGTPTSISGTGRGAIFLMLPTIAAIIFLFQQPFDVRHLSICTSDKYRDLKQCVPFDTWVDIVFNKAPIPEGTQLMFPFGEEKQREIIKNLGGLQDE